MQTCRYESTTIGCNEKQHESTTICTYVLCPIQTRQNDSLQAHTENTVYFNWHQWQTMLLTLARSFKSGFGVSISLSSHPSLVKKGGWVILGMDLDVVSFSDWLGVASLPFPWWNLREFRVLFIFCKALAVCSMKALNFGSVCSLLVWSWLWLLLVAIFFFSLSRACKVLWLSVNYSLPGHLDRIMLWYQL